MMPSTTGFSFGDIVLVTFPFTDHRAAKRRPAIVVSSAEYHRRRLDVVLMAVSARSSPRSVNPGEVVIAHWRKAGLLRPSIVKPVLGTFERGLLRKLGVLQEGDHHALRRALRWIFGSAS
jgi:mRNA interferase MazF